MRIKEIKNSFLKGISQWAWIIFVILIAWVVYAAEKIDIFNPWDPLTVTRINELVTEINDLKIELAKKADVSALNNKADKAYVDSEISTVEATLTDGIV